MIPPYHTSITAGKTQSITKPTPNNHDYPKQLGGFQLPLPGMGFVRDFDTEPQGTTTLEPDSQTGNSGQKRVITRLPTVTTKTILEMAGGIKRYLREQNQSQAKRESEGSRSNSRRCGFCFYESKHRLGFGANQVCFPFSGQP